MELSIHIDNKEDIDYITNLKENKDEILKSAITIGLKSISMSEIKMDCNSYFHPIKDIIDTSISTLEDKMDTLLFSKNNAAKKGKLGEKLCTTILTQYYPMWEINDVATDGYQGDCRIKTGEYEILCEFKTYETNINSTEVEKFKRDMKHTGLPYGIFISNTSGIVGKDTIEWEIYDNKILVYVSNMGLNGFGCIVGIEILKSLIEMNILNNNKNIYYENYKVDELKKSIEIGLNKLRNTNERIIKHRELLKEQRDKISKSFDLLERDIFEIEVELTNDLQDILNQFKDTNVNSCLITIFNEKEYLEKIEDQKIKTTLSKLFHLLTCKYDINCIDNDLLLNNGEFIIKVYKKKIEIKQSIKNNDITINILYDKIKGNNIVTEIKDENDTWNYLKKKLNI